MASLIDTNPFARVAVIIIGIVITGLLAASGLQILEHQKTIEKLEQKLANTEQELAISKLNLQNAEIANDNLNRVILLQQDIHKEAEVQRQSLTTALQQLQKDLKQAYGKLPKPVPPPPNYQEPKEDLQRSAQRLMVLWDAYCKTADEHPRCPKEKSL